MLGVGSWKLEVERVGFTQRRGRKQRAQRGFVGSYAWFEREKHAVRWELSRSRMGVEWESRRGHVGVGWEMRAREMEISGGEEWEKGREIWNMEREK